jgi:hypothetical protein
MEPQVILCTLVLNEMEWLPRLYTQHREWPGLLRWVFVESADEVFQTTNPELVKDGLSVDGTTDFLYQLARSDPRVIHIPYGISRHPKEKSQNKCAARQQYLEVAEKLEPDLLVVLDADEFYSRECQCRVVESYQYSNSHNYGFIYKQRHLWRPPSISDRPLFEYEVEGGYWIIPHIRGWRWEPGLRYEKNHNWPQDSNGVTLNYKGRVYRTDYNPNGPQCCHLGYSSSLPYRQAKHLYYKNRGEGVVGDAKRTKYVECRQAWEDWRPGGILPHGASIVSYGGPVPEVFKNQRGSRK